MVDRANRFSNDPQVQEDLNVIRRWNQRDVQDAYMPDEDAPILPSGRHMKYHHKHSGGHRSRHYRYAGDAVRPDEFSHDPRPNRLAHRDDNAYGTDDRGQGRFVTQRFDDHLYADVDDRDVGLDLDYRHGGAQPAGDAYYDDDMDAPVEEMYADAEDAPLEEEIYQVPIEWSESAFRFRKEVSLDSLQKKKVPAIVIDFGSTYKHNKAVQDLVASGDYLGAVSVSGLRAHNAHVSFAVRGESRSNPQMGYGSVPIKNVNEYLPNVDRVAHAVIPKRGPQAASGVDISLRDTAPVIPTWLSDHPDFTIHTLGKDIKETLTQGVDEISTQHPIAQWLIAEGSLQGEDLQDHDTVHVAHQDILNARRSIEAEERNNPKIGDARSLRLVINLAHSKREAGGIPQWNDTTEIADDYPPNKRTRDLIKTRQSKPIVIEGVWKIQHGHAASHMLVPMESAEGLDDFESS